MVIRVDSRRFLNGTAISLRSSVSSLPAARPRLSPPSSAGRQAARASAGGPTPPPTPQRPFVRRRRPMSTARTPTRLRASARGHNGRRNAEQNIMIVAERSTVEWVACSGDGVLVMVKHVKLRRTTEQINLVEGFNCLIRDLSTKLEDAEQKIISARQEMLQIKQEKEEMDRSYKERLYSDDTMIKEKDSLIKQLENSVDKNKSLFDSRLQCLEQELKLKDDVCTSLKGNLASSDSEKNSLELMSKGHILEIEKLCQDNKDLKKLLSSFMVKVTELDKELSSVSSHLARLISSFERFYEMAQEEKMLMARSSEDKVEHLQSQHVDLTSENNALRTNIEDLVSRLIQLQTIQEIMLQHVEEYQVAEDKIRRLESEAEVSTSNINRLEKLASELQGRIQKLLEDHKQKLLQKIFYLESNQELLGQVQSIMEENSNNAESLQGEITKRDQQVNTLENQIKLLCSDLDEKEQFCRRSVEREKTLEDQKLQVEASLSATECQLSEAKKQYDLMLEGEKIKLSKHLKELSSKHDQAINEIHKKYELEKIEITNAEKEKAEKLKSEIENKCNDKISQIWDDSRRHLMTMVERIKQDNDHRESTLRAYHKEELERIQSLAEKELRKQNDNTWDKRQLMYLFVLTSTVGLVFLLKPLLPAAYSPWIIMMIAALWGIGSIGFPCGLYGTARCEQEFSRYTGRLIYTVFAVFVIYGFYLLATRPSDISAPTLSALLKEGDASIDPVTVGFLAIGLIVLGGNIWASIRGCWTGSDRDL